MRQNGVRPARFRFNKGGRAGAMGGGKMISGTARKDEASGFYSPDMGMKGGKMYKKGGRVGKKKGVARGMGAAIRGGDYTI